MTRLKRLATMFVAVVALASGASATATERLKMSTTTSTENSGLLAELLPPFEKAYDCEVAVIAVGTGKALRLGKSGDVDVVFVHSRPSEDRFVEEGFGVGREDVMYNDFVILGPKGDPAALAESGTIGEAFRRLHGGGTPFVSRGDDSGTHKKEKALWKKAGLIPSGSWYVETGQGMGAVLKIADEKQGYTISDRGTYIAFADKISLIVIYQGDSELFNSYGIISVNPNKHPHVNYELGRKLVEFVTGPEGRRIIDAYKVKGQQLFRAHPE